MAEAGGEAGEIGGGSCDVVVVGGGVAGLVAAAALGRMGRSVMVLERRRSAEMAEGGADLALWPGAIAILKELGVGEEAFWKEGCFALETVHMCNMEFGALEKGMVAAAEAAATVLKTIDMGAVTDGTGERFVLVSRRRLMEALRAAVPEKAVVHAAEVTGVEEDEEADEVSVYFTLGEEYRKGGVATSVTSRVVIGADGARSRLRAHVASDVGEAEAVRFCGEVCYRGVLNKRGGRGRGEGVSEEVWAQLSRLFPDGPEKRTMRINYGAGLRSSFGYMSADGEEAYWWVKVQMAEVPKSRGKLPDCTWPEPLKTLHDLTPEEAFYMHAVEDSRALSRWSTPRVALVGDAAHVVTPNMGQGACLATEDAFVLATELAQSWRWPDGHLEAFYKFEHVRRPYAEAVAAEARKQLFLGQLTSRPAVLLREWVLKMVPSSVLQKTLRRNNFPVEAFLNAYREAVVVAVEPV